MFLILSVSFHYPQLFEKASANRHFFLKKLGIIFPYESTRRVAYGNCLLAQILGHADIETTKIYAIPSTEQLREALEKVPMPADAKEKPLWEGDEDEMARNCGLR